MEKSTVGRPPRTDGRKSQFVRVAVTDEERRTITTNTTPDERREVLLAYVDIKDLVKV